MKKYDIFICHAGENKSEVAEPLVESLNQKFKTWLDKEEILWGDNLIKKVSDGLSSSKFVIVILSNPFLGKPWPEKELLTALSREARTGESIILPLIVGDDSILDKIYKEYPFLDGKKFLFWNQGIKTITEELEKLFDRISSSEFDTASRYYKSESEQDFFHEDESKPIIDEKKLEQLFNITPDKFERYLKHSLNKFIDEIEEGKINNENLASDIKREFILTPIVIGELIDKEKSDFAITKTEYKRRTYKQLMYKCNFKFQYSGNGILFELNPNKGGTILIDDYLHSKITIFDNYFELIIETENDENYVNRLKDLINQTKNFLYTMVNQQKDFIDNYNNSLDSIITRTLENKKKKLSEKIKKDKDFDEIN